MQGQTFAPYFIPPIIILEKKTISSERTNTYQKWTWTGWEGKNVNWPNIEPLLVKFPSSPKGTTLSTRHDWMTQKSGWVQRSECQIWWGGSGVRIHQTWSVGQIEGDLPPKIWNARKYIFSLSQISHQDSNPGPLCSAGVSVMVTKASVLTNWV